MLQKIYKWIFSHKIIVAVVVIIIVVGGYYWYGLSGKSSQTSYVLTTVQKGTIVTAVSGSGQVSVSSQVDLSFKASDDVVSVNVLEGQEVKSGMLLAQLNSQDAQKAVRDAQDSLRSAKISLEKLQKPATALSITQAENALASAEKTKENANKDLVKAYEDGFNTVANAFIDFPTVISGLDEVLYGFDFTPNQNNLNYYADSVKQYNEGVFVYRDNADAAYKKARAAYDKNFDDYKLVNRYSDSLTIETIINETYETAKIISDAVKNANNLIQYYEDRLTERNLTPSATADTDLTTLNSYIGEINSHLTSLLSTKQTIQSDKDTIITSDRTIKEKTESLASVKAGTDELDIEAQQISIKQKENALLDAREQYANYAIYAPFDGSIAAINIKKGDTVSASTAAITMISKQQIAEMSLNEVDAAKVKVGQKATMTFDAVEDLSITGQVVQVDTLGTVSSGVVTYTVKINFDTQSDKIKPGMTVSASIIVDSKQDVLTVPSSAIKTNNDVSYVEVPNEDMSGNESATTTGVTLVTAPSRQTVEVGITDDSTTEIISGLNEGDMIVLKTVVTTSSDKKTSSGTSLFQFGGPSSGGRSSSSTSTSTKKATSTTGGVSNAGGMPPM
ncbi:MAG: efflux RND transporter periplasmic adaptor subunit [Patescibacteria group bacterium]|jgi:multidrug efflux pump subunit AcrA (membrane-fusion protein)